MGTSKLRLKRQWMAALLAVTFPGLACQIEAASCTPAASGLIAWWPADGTANDLLGVNNGLLQGGASASGLGFDGSAFSFDGTNGYVQIADSPTLRPTNLTVEAWVRFSSLDSVGSGGSPPGDQYIVFKQNSKFSDFEGFDLGKTRIAGNDYFQFIVSSSAGEVAHLESATTVSVGVWYHVAAVRDPNFIRLFVNGQLEGQTNVTFPQDYGTYPLFFGTSGQSYWDRKFKGTLDEVSLYDRALSAGEITAIYSAGAAGKCKAATILAQPQAQSVVLGGTALFSVGAAGLPPLRYQWQFNGATIGNATNSTYTLSNVQLSNAGNYAAVASNGLGATTSAVAVLTVLVPPGITSQPQSRTNVAGTAATFGASASGSGPLSFQWQFNGANISGGTDSNLTLNNVQPTDVGNYRVVVTNSAGSVTSAVAVLTVWLPPSISSQPQSRTNLVGTTAGFDVAANGTDPLSYQWRVNGANISGATGVNLTLGSVQASDAANYSVVVINPAGSATSVVAVLTVWVPPAITAQPQSRTNVVGTSVGFTVSASGTAPFSYQWQFNGASIGGATGASLTIGNVQLSDAGNYSVVATNVAGSVTSSVAVLTVLVPPAITTQPQSRTNLVGTSAGFTVAASGTTPLGYQWQFNGANISAATGTSLTLNNLQTSDAGSYAVVVTNAGGSIISAAAVLTVWVPPGIASQPQSRTNVLGTSAAFTVAANGTAPFAYQWQFNGADIAGATGATFTIASVQTSDAGTYAVTVTNSAGSVTSAAAVLTVLVPPAITVQPTSRTNVAGTSLAFSVAASGTAPLSYQWQFNGANIPGATGTGLTLNSLQASDAGNYSAVVTNAGGSITSAVAVLTVWVPPSIASQPQSRTNVVGTSAAFSVAANGTAPFNYQWQYNGANIGGATEATFTIGNVQASDAGNYAVLVTNSAGSVTSAAAILTVWVPPAIITQPQSRTNVSGTSAAFGVSASGTATLAYQWQFNGLNLLGATGTGLTLNNVQASDAGNYAVVVTNSGGSITSAVAILTVWVPPGIASQPQSHTNVIGTSAAFTVIANGTSPFSYQWQFNGANIAGATGAAFTVGNVQLSDAGNYNVVITNSAGSVTSAVAALTVWVPPNIASQPQSRTNVAGTSAGFSVAAAGTAPLSYQWQFNNATIPGGTGSSLNLNNAQPMDAGSYAVVVTNSAGSITSAVAVLTVWVPPNIASQPQSRTNIVGTSVSFSVTASGTTPLNYQWQRDGENITGAVGTSLLLTNLQLGDAGNYSAVVTNVAGSVTSAVAVLTIWTPPSISGQPQGRTNVLGTTAVFAVSAAGTPPLAYQWRLNGGNISGAIGTSLMINNVQLGDAGAYSVVVTNEAGAVTSALATLTVLLPPTITVQPRSRTTPAFVTIPFSATATGTPPFGYQWRFNGQSIPSASNSTFIVSPQLGDSGNYTVVVTNIAGAATSTVATLTIIPPADCVAPPVGLTAWWPGEGNANDIAGTNNGVLQGGASASVPAVVNSGLGFDGANSFVQISDSPSLKPTNLTVTCWVRFDSLDSVGNTPSAGQQFIVFKQNSRATSFEGFLLSKERDAGRDLFSWTVTSGAGQSVRIESVEGIVPGVWYHIAAVRGPDFLQLYVNGQLVSVTNVSFPQDYGSSPLYFASSGQPSFDRKLAGALDEVCLFNRPLSANEIASDYFAGINGKCKVPKFFAQPRDTVGYWGSSVSFTSSATGALPLKYQWRKNGVALSNATNSFLLLSNLQASDAGTYALQATNSFGTGTSDSAQLKVNVADVAISQSSIAGTQNVAALSISGVTGRLYGIQVSPSLGASNRWTGLTNIVLPSPTFAWFDPQSATQSQRFYRILPGPIGVSDGTWETSDIGAVWSDDFNRPTLGSNWVILGTANVSITNNELQFAQFNTDYSRQVYYLPWVISSDEWTIRWTQRFGALDATSFGVGVGIKNFQAAGGNDRGYNGLLLGTGPDLGKMQISRYDGSAQQPAAAANAISIAPGNIIDCSLTRSGWTMTATASNRANAQVSTSTLTYSEVSNLIAPTISRVCFYPLGGTVSLDNISFTINHRKPARFIVIGASASDGYNASSAARRYISVVQSNFFETVCNDSSSYNTTTNEISILPEILAHRPSTAILMIGGNDIAFGYPALQWQTQYSNLVAQLQMNGVIVKHTFQTPRNGVDLRPLKDWVTARYPAGDIIDTWTPFVTNSFGLKPIYDSGDGVHPNDLGHLLLGQIIRTNLP